MEFFLGLYNGLIMGVLIGFIIWNIDYKFGDYDYLKEVYCFFYVDFIWDCKFGVCDYCGGGRISVCEMVLRVVVGVVV